MTTTSEALAQEEDSTYSCNMSTAGKIALGVVGGLLAVGAVFWALVYTSDNKKAAGVHTAVPKAAGGEEEDLEEATTSSESSSAKQ